MRRLREEARHRLRKGSNKPPREGPERCLRKLRAIGEILRPYRLRLIAALVTIMSATAVSLAPPYLAGRAIDDAIRPGDLSALNLIVMAFIAAALIYWLAGYAQTYLVGWVGQKALADLRARIFAHLQSLSVGFFARRRSGVLISRMTNDVQALDQLVTNGLSTLISNTLTLVGIVIILLLLDTRLALVTFLAFPVFALASAAFRIAAAGAYRLAREKIAAISAYLQETLSGVRIIKTFAQEPRHRKRFAELNEENRAANMRTVYLNASYYPSIELLSAVGTAVVLLYGGYQALAGNVQIGVLVAFIGYLQLFFDPIQQLSSLYTTYQQGVAALDKIFDLLGERPDLTERPDARDLPRLDGEVRLERVSFSYGGDGWALSDIDLVVPPGRTLALVGHTGAGKSTLAKLVARFYDPQHGAVLIDGHDLRDVTFASLRSQLGIVPQEGYLFSGSVRDNIAFGRPDATDEQIAAATRAVGGLDFIARLPQGFDTEVGERGSHLSAGQRQLIAFARALIAEPRILILDEATSSVDVHTEARIERGLARLLEGRTAIVIAHRLSTIRNAGRIAVLEHGRVVELGTHGELIAGGGAYQRLYHDWAGQAAA